MRRGLPIRTLRGLDEGQSIYSSPAGGNDTLSAAPVVMTGADIACTYSLSSFQNVPVSQGVSLPANAQRVFLLIQNIGQNPIAVNFTTQAQLDSVNYRVNGILLQPAPAAGQPGGYILLDKHVSTDTIYVINDKTGFAANFTITQGTRINS